MSGMESGQGLVAERAEQQLLRLDVGAALAGKGDQLLREPVAQRVAVGDALGAASSLHTSSMVRSSVSSASGLNPQRLVAARTARTFSALSATFISPWDIALNLSAVINPRRLATVPTHEIAFPQRTANVPDFPNALPGTRRRWPPDFAQVRLSLRRARGQGARARGHATG